MKRTPTTPKNPASTDSLDAPAEPVARVIGLRHAFVGIAVAGLLAVVSLAGLHEAHTTADRYAVLLLPCVVAGAAVMLAADFLVYANRGAKNFTALYWVLDRLYDRLVVVLVDNPDLARDARIRKAFMPSDEDLRIYKTSASVGKRLREVRDGTSWLIQGEVAHTGPSLATDLESTQVAYYKTRAAEARRERDHLVVQLQQALRALAEVQRGV